MNPHDHLEMTDDYTSSATTADKALWAAVLTQAIVDAIRSDRKYRPRSFAARNTYHRYEAKCFFADPDTRRGSFLWICAHLDLDPDSIRARVLSERVDRLNLQTVRKVGGSQTSEQWHARHAV